MATFSLTIIGASRCPRQNSINRQAQMLETEARAEKQIPREQKLAVANAVFAACGQRARKLPISLA